MSLEEKVAYQEARIRYLEDYVEFQKKNAFHTGGDILILQRQEVKEDKLFMAYDYISRGKAKREWLYQHQSLQDVWCKQYGLL
ncbi:MAG: hypothetical protein ACLT4K_02340 [Catenibacterium sp.]